MNKLGFGPWACALAVMVGCAGTPSDANDDTLAVEIDEPDLATQATASCSGALSPVTNVAAAAPVYPCTSTSCSLQVSWTPTSANVNSYRVMLSVSGGPFTEIGAVAQTSCTRSSRGYFTRLLSTLPAMPKGTTHQVRVDSVNNTTRVSSATASFTVR